MKVQIKDALWRKIAAATSQVALTAKGRLQPGVYSVHNVQVRVADDTTFSINVRVPIKSSTEINCGDATGSMSTSKALTVLNVPAPQNIQLKNGTASADVDLARTLVTLVLNSLQGLPTALMDQSQQTPGNPLSALIAEVDVPNAQFDLKGGPQIELPFGDATLGPQSKLQFKDIHFDKLLNYKGDCLIDLSLPHLHLNDSKTKRDVQFESAKVKLAVRANKQGNVLSLELPAPEPNAFSAVSVKVSDPGAVVTCGAFAIKLDRAAWRRTLLEEQSESSFSGSVDLVNAFFQVDRNNMTVRANVPALSGAALEFDTKSGDLKYTFLANRATAHNVVLKGANTKSSFDINLKQTQIEKLSLTRAAGFSLGFTKAVCEPTVAHWASGKRMLLLRFSPGSSMLLNSFGVQGDEKSWQGSAKVPLVVHAGGLHLESNSGTFDCDGLDGKLQFTLENQNIQSDGKFNVNVRSSDNVLGVVGAHATINGLTCHADDHQIAVDLPHCRVIVPPEQLRQAILSNLPKRRVFDVDKTVFEGRKWRYRKFKLARVIVSNPTLDKLTLAKQGEFTFSGSSDVAANGTVEKFELHPLRRGDRTEWKVLPWAATGHASGTGNVLLKFAPGATLADSTLQYKASFRMPIPDKLTIDWSGVSGDILGKAEQAVVQQVIKNADYFTPQQGIPIDSVGEVKPFKSKKSRLQQIKVRNVTMTPGPDGVAIDLSGRAAL